jgi:hypothetical protein
MKTETIEEYLARGGAIERLPYVDKATPEPVRVTAGSNIIITMEEGDLYNGEAKKRKKSSKTEIKVDTSKLPADLIKSLTDLGVKLS